VRSILLLVGFALATPDASAQESVTLPGRDRPIAASVEPLFRIGVAEGGDWETFADVTAVAFDARGRLYVVDRGARRVLVYDSSGRFQRELGRIGGGPGEFMLPVGVAVTADGLTAVGDAGHRSILLFDAEGRHVRSVSLGNARPLLTAIKPALEGGVLVQETPTSTIEPGYHIIYYHSLDAGAELLPRYRVPRADTTQLATRREGTILTRTLPPAFGPAVRFAPWGANHVAVAARVDYALTTAGARTDVARVIRRGLSPRRVTEADREAVRARRRARASDANLVTPAGFAAGGATGDALEAELRRMRFADVMPVITELAADQQGRLWIARAGSTALGPGPIDILEPTGRYAGTILDASMPHAFGPDGRTARVEWDGMGVQRVIVERVRLPAASTS
jgi:hypothetical protein